MRQWIRSQDGWIRKLAEWSSTSFILIAVGIAPLDPTSDMPIWLKRTVIGLEFFILGFFTIEYLLRLWIAKRPLLYVFSLYGLIDLLSVLPFYLALGVDITALRSLRLLRLVRLWKHRGYTRVWVRLFNILKESKDEAIIFLMASVLIIYIAAVGIHQFEGRIQPQHFGTFSQSLWWAVGLLLDVEYGEVWPVTFFGKLFTAIIALVGIAIIAVPAGMIAGALIRAVRKNDE